MSLANLSQVVHGLCSENEVERQKSEQLYESLSQDPLVIPSLLEIIISKSEGTMERVLSAVLFRRSISKVVSGLNLWKLLPLERQMHCQKQLIQALITPDVPLSLKNKIADGISEIAHIFKDVPQGSWPELMDFLQGSANNPDNAKSALRIICEVPELISAIQSSHLASFLETFLFYDNIEVRALALKAFEGIINEEKDESRLLVFCPLISQMPQVLNPIISSNDSFQIVSALNSISELMTSCPKLFKNIVIPLGSALCPLVITSIKCDEDICGAALEVILCICEIFSSLVRRNKNLVSQISKLILDLICSVEDDPEWYTADPTDEDSDDIDPLGILGEQAMDRFSIALGGKCIIEPLFIQLIVPYLSSKKWQHRYGALKAIASAAEGCADVLVDKLDDLMSVIWPCFEDPSPRVQYAACHALGQLCTDFSGILQESYCKESLSSLVKVLCTSAQPRVQQHSAAALVNFAEGVEPTAIEPFLSDIIERFVSLISQSQHNLSLQQQLVTTIAAFSGASGSLFSKYYDLVVPLLLNCLTIELDSKYRMLQCRSLEAISLIAHAVGKAKFISSPSTNDFIQALIKLTEIMNSSTESSNMMQDFIPQAWVRLCQVLKDDFTQFLPIILPILKLSALQEPDVAVLDVDQPIDFEQYKETEWEFTNVKGRKLGIRTSGLEEKCQALENLTTIIQSLTLKSLSKESCKDLHDVVFLPLLSFELHEGVQANASQGLVSCLNLLVQTCSNDAEIGHLVNNDLQVLIEKSINSFSVEFTTSAIDAVSSILEQHPKFCSPAIRDHFPHWIEQVSEVVTHEIKERYSKFEEGEEDNDLGDEPGGEEEDVLYALSRFISALGKVHIPFDGSRLIQYVARWILKLGLNNSLLQHSSFCILDELVKANYKVSAESSLIIKCYQKGLQSEDKDILQASLFGIGHLSLLPEFRPFIIQSVPKLLSIIKEENGSSSLKDNSVSALARIIHNFGYDKGLVDQVFTLWISGFPVITDEEEVPISYQVLVNLLRMYSDLTRSLEGSVLISILKTPLDKGFHLEDVQSLLNSL